MLCFERTANFAFLEVGPVRGARASRCSPTPPRSPHSSRPIRSPASALHGWGRSFEALPEVLAGAVGEDIAPGTGKQIVWAALVDFPQGIAGQDNRVRLAVEEQGGGGFLWVLGGAIVAGAGTTVGLLLGGGGGESEGGGNTGGNTGIPTPPDPPN